VPKRLQRSPCAGDRVGEQVAIRAVDPLDARTHEASELEETDARCDRPSGERVPQRIGRAVLEPRRSRSRCPWVSSSLVQVQVPATSAWKEQRRINSEWQPLECGECGSGNGTTRASALLCVFRGQAFRQQGFHDAAHETLKEALRSKSRAAPIRHMALAERAQNYFAQGKKGMVRKDLERILAEDSDYSNVRERLSQLDPDTANARRGSSLLPLCGGPLLYPGFTIRLL
jgi:tetratricopeptide (TPR) repeat protein